MSLFVLVYLRDHSIDEWIFFSLKYVSPQIYVFVCVCVFMCVSFSHRWDVNLVFFYRIRDRQSWSFLWLFDTALDEKAASFVRPDCAHNGFVTSFLYKYLWRSRSLYDYSDREIYFVVNTRHVLGIDELIHIFLLQMRSTVFSLPIWSWKERHFAHSQRQYIW